MTHAKQTGGCLCRKIRYEITSAPLSQGICYCRQCAKCSGPYGSPLLVLRKETFTCSLQDQLSFFETMPDQGSPVRRNFCASCGTHVFAELTDFPEILTVKAATLDDVQHFVPEYLVFTASAGASCLFPPGVPSYPESAPLEILAGRV